ncbi:pupal cuticle protein [Lutzomyia longipalpis]|uniref:pupal cuticle protein n=1 Tax=Lutzomyia longipalpis TaxID=7200 RepID=UPI0024844F36|nr:pupal cuticle protein [Lutzomyia longipalpis]
MKKIIILLGLSAVVFGVKLPRPKSSLKYATLDYFKDDKDIALPEDDDEDKPPTIYEGDVKQAKTLNQENFNQGKGKFKYTLETQNGISIAQAGKLKDEKTFVVMGSYSYTGADGKRYRVKYTADEFGYHPITELEVDIPEIEIPETKIQPIKPFTFKPFHFNDLEAPPKPAKIQVRNPQEDFFQHPRGENPFAVTDDKDGGDVNRKYLPPSRKYLPPTK